MNLIELAREPGVKDLKPKARVAFAKALKAEAEDNRQEAEEYLAQAIEAQG